MLTVENLTKVYANAGDGIAGGVRDASFTLSDGAFFTLLGPSGCGKTTTLRSIAGLETPDSGRVALDGRVLFDGDARTNVPMNRREIGMVFQSYAIWPHMTVAENVAFPLTVGGAKVSRSEVDKRVAQALETMDLAGYQSRPATRLSGGEQQRVALARAIVRTPRLLLLDEPLSNLDAQLREDMRAELKRLQRQIGVTTVYVTHDQSEALALSDTIAVLSRGRIAQVGSPRDIYSRPASEFVARFLGATNLLPARMLERGVAGRRAAVEIAGGLRLMCALTRDEPVGAEVVVAARPEHLRLVPGTMSPAASENAIPGKVRQTTFLGATTRIEIVTPAGVPLHVAATSDAAFAPGADVTALVYIDRTAAVPREA
ncbi:MAG: ABC transporter ATP-binding protein [Gemmatimonas sp.]